MRLGGPLFSEHDSPESWIEAVKTAGYRAAFCPLEPSTGDAVVAAYAEAARRNDVVIEEGIRL